MPSWCSNSMVVYGSPTEIKDFRQRLLNAMKLGGEFKPWHLYQIYKEFGYSEQFILNGEENNGYIRGNFNYIGEIKHEGPNEDSIRVDYESAWSSMYEGFDWLLSRHYKTLKEVTIAEECSNDVYINTDVTGRFFEERYCVYVEDQDTYYFESEDQVADLFTELTGKKCIDIGDCYKLLKDCDGYLGPNETLYTTLNEYSCD